MTSNPDAVVAHGKHDCVVIRTGERQLGGRRMSVSRDVGQGLLSDSVDDEFVLGGQRQILFDGAVDAQAGLADEEV